MSTSVKFQVPKIPFGRMFSEGGLLLNNLFGEKLHYRIVIKYYEDHDAEFAILEAKTDEGHWVYVETLREDKFRFQMTTKGRHLLVQKALNIIYGNNPS